MLKIIFTIGLLFSTSGFAASVPQIFFEYGEPFDLFCPRSDKVPITDELQNSLKNRIPKLQTLWNEQGVKLLKVTQEILGAKFKRKEESAALVLCHIMPPMSHPLMIRMRETWKTSNELNPDFYFLNQAL